MHVNDFIDVATVADTVTLYACPKCGCTVAEDYDNWAQVNRTTHIDWHIQRGEDETS